MRQTKAWILSGSAAALVLVGSAVAVPLLTDDNPTAAPVSSASVTMVPVSPKPKASYSPVTNFYQQAGPPANSPLDKVAPQVVTVSNEPVGTELTDSHVGISLEATDLDDTTLSADNTGLVDLLKGLGKPVLRFGGNAVDRRFFWTSTGEAIPSDYKGDKTHPVRSATPKDFTRLNGLLEAADASISLTVDLGHFDPDRGADMVKHASQIFGKRLVAVTIGNEPNGYASNGVRPDGYITENFLSDAKAYADAIYAVAPNVPISGPGTYTGQWWRPFAQLDLKQQKILTFHHYPMSDCKAKNPAEAPTMANLLSPRTHDHIIDFQRVPVQAAKDNKMQVWLPEAGVTACPGSNETSKTYASALWSADFALSAGQSGIQQVDFHSSMMTCKGGPPMSVICAEGEYLKPTGTIDPRANYFGVAMAGAVGPGKFLKLNNDGGGLAYSYAVQKADGSTSVVLINENDPQKAAQTQVTLNLPNIPVSATMTQMTGPSYKSQDGVKIDGGAAPVAADKRPAPMNFKPGAQTQTFPLTAGTVTILNFKY